MSAAARISGPDASAGTSTSMKLRAVYREGAGDIHLDWPRDRIPDAIADRQGTLWVDIENAESASTREAETLLRQDFGFHALAVEDAIDESHIPKIDDWGEYIYLVFHGTSIDPRTDELRLHELDIFLGLITWSPIIPNPSRSSTRTASRSSATPATGSSMARITCSSAFWSGRWTSRWRPSSTWMTGWTRSRTR